MTFHIISSLSNASLDRYPNNTLSKFVHHFPKSIQFDLTKQHTIQLRSISLYCKLKLDTPAVSYIKVHLEEIDPRSSVHNGDAQCLARIPFTYDSKNSMLWYEFNHPVSIPLLDVENIRELSFLITDGDNNQLQLETGPTTIINTLIEEMKFRHHFTMTCSPSYSRTIYPDNTNSDYRMHFPSAIELDEDWEVALHSVIVPQNVEIKIKCLISFAYDGFYDQHEWTVTHEDEDATVLQIFTKIQEWGLELTDDGNNSLAIKEKMSNRPVEGKLFFNSALCHYYKMVEKEEGGGYAHQFWPGEMLVMNLPEKSFPIQHVAIYTDILTDSIMGNSLAPLLEIVSTKNLGLDTSTTDTVYHAPHISFRPLGKTTFSSLHVFIASIKGEKIICTTDDPSISLTLMFRKAH